MSYISVCVLSIFALCVFRVVSGSSVGPMLYTDGVKMMSNSNITVGGLDLVGMIAQLSATLIQQQQSITALQQTNAFAQQQITALQQANATSQQQILLLVSSITVQNRSVLGFSAYAYGSNYIVSTNGPTQMPIPNTEWNSYAHLLEAFS